MPNHLNFLISYFHKRILIIIFFVCNLFSISLLPSLSPSPPRERKRDGSCQLWRALSSLEESPPPETFSVHLNSLCLFPTWNVNKTPPLELTMCNLFVTYVDFLAGKVLFSISTHSDGPTQGRICVLGRM